MKLRAGPLAPAKETAPTIRGTSGFDAMSTQYHSTRPEGTGALFVAILGYCLITFMRPQDFIPGVGAIKPGMIFGLLALFLWFGTRDRTYLADSIPKLMLSFLFATAIGATFATNKRMLFAAFQDLATYGVVFTLALPVVLSTHARRKFFLRFLLGCYVFIAAWVTTHNGHGQGAFLEDENDAALALNVGICLAFSMARFEAARLWKLAAIGAVLLCVAGVVVSDSRGGLVGLVAVGVALALFSRQLLRTLLIVSVVVVAVIPFVPASYTKDMRTMSDPNDPTRKERIYSWNRGMEMFWANPVLGVGANNFPNRVAEFEHSAAAERERGNRRSITYRAAHSLYFTLLPETGLLGTAIYLALLMTALSRCWNAVQRALPDAHGDDRRMWAYFIGSALVAFSVCATFISVLLYPYFWMLVSFAMLLSPMVGIRDGNLYWAARPKRPRAE